MPACKLEGLPGQPEGDAHGDALCFFPIYQWNLSSLEDTIDDTRNQHRAFHPLNAGCGLRATCNRARRNLACPPPHPLKPPNPVSLLHSRVPSYPNHGNHGGSQKDGKPHFLRYSRPNKGVEWGSQYGSDSHFSALEHSCQALGLSASRNRQSDPTGNASQL